MFDDPWFMDLSVDSKLLYIYFITNCDHAGIIKVNWKLIEFQTGIKELLKNYKTLLIEFGNRVVYLDNGHYFLPKFIIFQYPDFPKSNVMQQQGAIKRLKEFNLFDEKTQNLNKELLEFYNNINEENDK